MALLFSFLYCKHRICDVTLCQVYSVVNIVFAVSVFETELTASVDLLGTFNLLGVSLCQVFSVVNTGFAVSVFVRFSLLCCKHRICGVTLCHVCSIAATICAKSFFSSYFLYCKHSVYSDTFVSLPLM